MWSDFNYSITLHLSISGHSGQIPLHYRPARWRLCEIHRLASRKTNSEILPPIGTQGVLQTKRKTLQNLDKVSRKMNSHIWSHFVIDIFKKQNKSFEGKSDFCLFLNQKS